MSNRLTWWGHSAWRLETSQGRVLLFDPWLSQNPVAPIQIAQLGIDARLNRPPMPRTDATGALLAQVQALAAQAGFTLEEAPMTGGGSDANFVAALGVPTLDGLGAEGDGAHTLWEHVIVETLPQRLAFVH